jgi:Protein of unknown function (DUF3263)
LTRASPATRIEGLMGLATRDRAILDFERSWCMRSGAKEVAIRTELGVSGTSYYQRLRALLDDPDAYEYDPLTVRRLRRQRERRRRERLEGKRAGPESR